MTNSFLILFITIKAEIVLILQSVSINTHSIKTEKKYSLNLSNSFPSALSHTHLLFVSLKKHIEGGRKSNENIRYTSSFSSITTHINTHFFYLC